VSPVVDVRKKRLYRLNVGDVVPDGLDQKAVQVIFLVILVRQDGEKCFRLRDAGIFFCKFPQLRRPTPITVSG
jgi:hypothetical protein